MMKKTVDSIRKTELEARKILEDATIQVDEKRKAAQEKAKKNQEDAIASAHKQAQQALKDAKTKGEAILDVAQKAAIDEANALRAEARTKEAMAIQLVIENII